MDCRTLEQQLDALVAASSTDRAPEAAGLDAEARDHLAGCVRCRQLYEVALGRLDVLGEGAGRRLTESIVAQTTGSSCARAAEMLPELFDNALSAAETELVHLHLQHCAPCAQLHETLAWIAGALPELAEIAPDAAFVDDVLRVTSRAQLPVALRAQSRLRKWWQQMMARPRFALELAYSVAVVVALLCGTPLSPLRGTPGKVLSSVQLRPDLVLQTAAGPVGAVGAFLGSAGTHLWDATAGRLADATGGARADWRARRAGIDAGWSLLRAHLREATHGLFAADVSRAALSLQQVGGDCRLIWVSLWRGGAGADGSGGGATAQPPRG